MAQMLVQRTFPSICGLLANLVADLSYRDALARALFLSVRASNTEMVVKHADPGI
jgi:hypothetical protein